MMIISCIILYACLVNRGEIKNWFMTEILEREEVECADDDSMEMGDRNFNPVSTDSIAISDVIITDTDVEYER